MEVRPAPGKGVCTHTQYTHTHRWPNRLLEASIHSSIHLWIYSYHFQKGDDIDFHRLAVGLMFILECVGAAHSTPAAAHLKKKEVKKKKNLDNQF